MKSVALNKKANFDYIISEKIEGKEERFDLFSNIKHIFIPGGNFFRRPIYSSAIFYYKLRDLINYL